MPATPPDPRPASCPCLHFMQHDSTRTTVQRLRTEPRACEIARLQHELRHRIAEHQDADGTLRQAIDAAEVRRLRILGRMSPDERASAEAFVEREIRPCEIAAALA